MYSTSIPRTQHPLLAAAAAHGYTDPVIDRLARIVASHGRTPPAWLPDRALAARINAEREARTKLARHIDLTQGAL